jgi:hypothetical protein
MAAHQARDFLDGRPFHEAVGGLFIAQQRFDLLAEGVVTHARLTKERCAIRCLALERGMTDLRDQALPIGRHLDSRRFLWGCAILRQRFRVFFGAVSPFRSRSRLF